MTTVETRRTQMLLEALFKGKRLMQEINAYPVLQNKS
jgi:hypothetical protein